MVNLQEFKSFIVKPRKVAVIMHHKPDADALGSSLGLAAYLKKLNHQVSVISPSDYPSFLEWLPGNNDVLVYQNNTAEKVARSISGAELIFCLDFSSLRRIHELGAMVKESKAKKVLIDHHLEPEHFAEFEQWDDTAASTAELVYQLIYDLGHDDLVDATIAECLYAGIMTDTGSFRHNNTNHKVFLIAGKLVAHGANPHKISKLIYDNNTLERLRLTGFVLGQKLQVLPEYKTAYIVLSKEELSTMGSQTGDTEGLVNFGLSIKDIILSVLIYERKDGTVKLSFRSLDDFSVNDLARKHFEGGGHRNAAGGQSHVGLAETLKKLIDILPLYKDQLSKKN
ncbi:MAG TPA: bifunctional oligoribonuclease/PAP phosphatase NrnA [Cyclobacteriaceae bacterium]|nr:bifunctional oligoribonuclease/PAP phosphatase NrnA [Cyclobacteriaceae bacterium]